MRSPCCILICAWCLFCWYNAADLKEIRRRIIFPPVDLIGQIEKRDPVEICRIMGLLGH